MKQAFSLKQCLHAHHPFELYSDMEESGSVNTVLFFIFSGCCWRTQSQTSVEPMGSRSCQPCAEAESDVLGPKLYVPPTHYHI